MTNDPLRRAVDKAFEQATNTHGQLSRHALVLALREVLVTGPCDHHPDAMHSLEYICQVCTDAAWADMKAEQASAAIVSPPQEHSTRFVWLMERRLARASGLLGAIAAGTLVYWDGGHAESFTTDANQAVQWPSEAAAKAQCPPEHYEQWGWRYVEHGFIPVVQAGSEPSGAK